MASVTLNQKEWLSHLSPISTIGWNDLKVNLTESPSTIQYAIGAQTHYLSVKKDCPNGAVKKTGHLIISDLENVCTFLKKCDGDVTFKQITNGKTLYLVSENIKMNLPVTDCKSSQLIPKFERLVSEAEENAWRTFGSDEYTVHGKAELEDVLKLTSLKRLVSKDADFTITANAESKALSVTMGKTPDVKVFCTAKLEDTEGPEQSVRSNFGAWLLPCLSLTNSSLNTEIHFGDESGLVLEQNDDRESRLLIIVDQQG